MADAVDINLNCCDCSQPFVWMVGEQEFFAKQGFSQPRRCKPCRAARKADRSGGSSQASPPELPVEAPRGDRKRRRGGRDRDEY